ERGRAWVVRSRPAALPRLRTRVRGRERKSLQSHHLGALVPWGLDLAQLASKRAVADRAAPSPPRAPAAFVAHPGRVIASRFEAPVTLLVLEAAMQSDARGIIQYIRDVQDTQRYRANHWNGTFEDYLDLFLKNPRVARNAYQRIYDMVLAYGVEEYVEQKEKITRYKFFMDPDDGGRDAIYGLDRPLMRLVDVFKSAAHGYGTERRVLLLHGPVGSAKSTIVRLLKKGLERYSRGDTGALYTFAWRDEASHPDEPTWARTPMHQEPMYLVRKEIRGRDLNKA